MDEVTFPKQIDAVHYWTCYPPEEVEDWFKRCMKDYPNIKAILEAKQDLGMSRSFQALLLVNEWRVKWFSQFLTKDDGNERVMD